MEFESGQFINLFLEEAEEQMQGMTESLLILEENPGDRNAIQEMFRLAHTLKGSAGMVGFHHISSFAHKMEDVLDLLREGELVCSSTVVDVLLNCLDVLKEMLAALGPTTAEEKKNRAHVNATKALQKLESLQNRETPAEETPAEVSEETFPPFPVPLSEDLLRRLDEMRMKGLRVYQVHVGLAEKIRMPGIRAFLVCNAISELGEVILAVPDVLRSDSAPVDRTLDVLFATDQIDPEEIRHRCGVDEVEEVLVREVENDDLIVTKSDEIPEDEPETLLPEIAAEGPEPEEKSSGGSSIRTADASASRTVRVDIEKLDQLLNLAGELVINRGRALELSSFVAGKDSDLAEAVELYENIVSQGRIVTQLQEAIMSTRMVPIGQVFTRFKRVVRDLAHAKNKKVQLEINGSETELDKKIIDLIGEPLTHMVRNSVDHGIEIPEERRKAGKSEIGTIRFDAFHEGNNIRVEVEDDGRGLDVEAIRKKAIDSGLYSEAEADGMTEKNLVQSIFLPGFSTAKEVSDVSGRGVGLDVVRRKIEELGGTVELNTRPGQGTQFIIKLPLTLAIIQALLVEVNREIYAIPIANVAETLRIDKEEVFTVENRAEVIRLRERVVPLLRLDRLLGKENLSRTNGHLYVAVVGEGEQQAGLVVDRMVNEQEIVIKSLTGNFRKADYLAGASIMGNGEVCLILDTSVLVNTALRN